MTMVRFVVQGSLNAVVTFLTYIAVLQWFNYAISYTVSFAVGILFAYLVNRSFVFRVRGSSRTFFVFSAVYVILYGVGLAITTLLVPIVGREAAPVGALAFNVPLSFVMTRFVFAHS
jgi:putative flippase GtrA